MTLIGGFPGDVAPPANEHVKNTNGAGSKNEWRRREYVMHPGDGAITAMTNAETEPTIGHGLGSTRW